MDEFIHVPLNLPDIRILEVKKTEGGHWLIRIESTLTGTKCTRCGGQITDFHGYDDPVRLRHLPIFEVPVYLELRPKRYRCRSCEGQPTTTQRCTWYELRSPNTKAYEQWLLRLLIDSTVCETARKLGISEETVEGVLERCMAHMVEWSRYEELGTLGIDEIALTRGHGDFVVLVTTPCASGVEVLAVLADRRKETVAAFLASIPRALRRTIERVCTDMYRGYVEAAREALPGAQIVVDRFPVARAYRECADTVRKKEIRRLKRELSQSAYQEIQGLMWPFRKRTDELAEGEWERLERLFAYSRSWSVPIGCERS